MTKIIKYSDKDLADKANKIELYKNRLRKKPKR